LRFATYPKQKPPPGCITHPCRGGARRAPGGGREIIVAVSGYTFVEGRAI